MLERLGAAVYRARWAVIVFWVILTLGAATVAPRITSILHGGGYTIGNSQSEVAYNVLHRAYGYKALTFTIVFTAPAGERHRLPPAAARFRRRAQSRLHHQLTIGPPIWTPDHAVMFERVYSTPRGDFGASFSGPLQSLLPGPPIHAYLTGPPEIFHDMEVVSDQDLRRIELVTLPIAAIILLLIFRSAVAAAIPVLMAPISVSLALAAIYFLGHRIQMSIFVLNTGSMLGLGVAIDYSLFMVNRFQEELATGRAVGEAVARAVATSGRAILVSATVVTIGFFSLTLTGVQMLSSIGIGGSIVTALSLLVALTFVPSILGVLGPRINLLPVVPRRLFRTHFWEVIAFIVMRRPFWIIGLVTAIIIILSSPVAHLHVGVPGPQILPKSVEARAGNDILDRHLGVANREPVLVVAERKPGTPLSTARSAAFAVLDRICSSPVVVGVSPVPVPNSPAQIQSCSYFLNRLQRAGPTSLTPRSRRVALLSVFIRPPASSTAAERYVRMLRDMPAPPGYRILVGGQTAGQMDFDNYMYSHFPIVVLFVIGTIFLILLLAFRSVLLPLKAVFMNLFSIAVGYGVVVFVFQDNHFSGLLHFTSVNDIDSIVPVFLFSVLFGISTDYEVFLLSRVQEAYLLTGNNESSVAAGLAATGRIITSAALIMIVVFGAFAFARLVVIQELGLGLAVAVLVDATLIRVLLVPATMRVLGRWNWWLPGRGFPQAGPTRGRPAAAE